MSIKERLREAMDAKSLTIKALSDLSKIPYRSLQNYLRGEREPNAEALVALSTHLNISIDWLLTGKGEAVGVRCFFGGVRLWCDGPAHRGGCGWGKGGLWIATSPTAPRNDEGGGGGQA